MLLHDSFLLLLHILLLYDKLGLLWSRLRYLWRQLCLSKIVVLLNCPKLSSHRLLRMNHRRHIMLVRICHELLLLRLLLPGCRHLGLLVLSACGSERHHVGCRHLRGGVDGRAGWLFLEGCFGCGLLRGFGRYGAGLGILRL